MSPALFRRSSAGTGATQGTAPAGTGNSRGNGKVSPLVAPAAITDSASRKARPTLDDTSRRWQSLLPPAPANWCRPARASAPLSLHQPLLPRVVLPGSAAHRLPPGAACVPPHAHAFVGAIGLSSLPAALAHLHSLRAARPVMCALLPSRSFLPIARCLSPCLPIVALVGSLRERTPCPFPDP